MIVLSPNLASQLIDFPYGNGLEVALGGGRYNFMTNTSSDPETKQKGKRKDGRNLIDEWTSKTKANDNWAYVWNDKQFKQLDVNKVDHVLGTEILIFLRITFNSKIDIASFPFRNFQSKNSLVFPSLFSNQLFNFQTFRTYLEI